MKKADLIKGIAQKAGITNEQAQNALEATLDLIKQSVVEQRRQNHIAWIRNIRSERA